MLFISHKSEDSAIANEVLRRALEHGYSAKQIFLDNDPGSGIEAGAEWERKIYESLKHTRAMIVLCSPNWLKSQWCALELGYAKAMAISVFPLVIEPYEVGGTLSATQAVDLTGAADEATRDAAFKRLWTALDAQHLGPKDNPPWPPPGETDNCPFPGLMFFDEKQAPVFFGREPERDAVIQQLQEMRGSGVPRLLMIVGGSGSGKSSLLRAGVLPWLKHPTERRNWLVLPTLRYGETPNDDVTLLARLAEAITESYPSNCVQRPSWKELRDNFESDDVDRAARDFVDATLDVCHAWRATVETTTPTTHSAPTLVLAIDQFEELLTAAARPSAQKFLRFLRTLLSRSNGRLLVIGTMRSDYLDTYEQHAESLKPPFLELYRLPPFPWERVTDVITKPAERVDVTFADELITRLKEDAPDSDALPLLAFTLEKLYRLCGTDKLIELREYEQIGGMTGALTQAVTRILPKNMSKEAEQALRRSFVNHLVQVNEKDEFVRRRAHWHALPNAAKPLLEEFVRRERLLQRSGSKGELVEVTHEAIFRCWDQLKKWLQDDLPMLYLRRRVEALAEEWQRSHNAEHAQGDEGLLLTRAQVASLDEWLQQGDIVLAERQSAFVEASREKCQSDEQREIGRLRQLAEVEAEKTRQAEARRQAEEARAVEAEARQAAEAERAAAAEGRRQAEQRQRETETRRANEAVKHAQIAKRFTASIAVVALMAVGLGFYANRKRTEADNNAIAANQQKDKANRATIVAIGEAEKARKAEKESSRQLTNTRWQQGFLSRDGLGDQDRAAWAFLAAAEVAQKLDLPKEKRNALLAAQMTGNRALRVLKCDKVRGAIWSQNGSRVLLWSGAGDVKVWDLERDEVVVEWKHGKPGVGGARFSRDENRVLSWGNDGATQLWDVNNRQPLQKWVHDDVVNGAVFDREETHVLTWSEDGTARLWDPEQKLAVRVWNHDNKLSETRLFQSNPRAVVGAVFDNDQKRVLTWSNDGTARLWDVATDKALQTWHHEDAVTGATFSADELTVLTWSGNEVRLFDVSHDKPLQIWKHDKPTKQYGADRVLGAVFSSNGTRVLTWGGDGARLWDINQPHHLRSWKRSNQYSDGFVGAVFYGDESRVLTWGDAELQLWAIDQDLALKTWKADSVIADVVALSKDSLILTLGNYGISQLWRVSEDKPRRTWKHYQRPAEGGSGQPKVLSARVSQDGLRVLTRSIDDRAAYIWDVGREESLRSFDHGEESQGIWKWGVWGAEFDGRERRVLTWGGDGTVRVWDATQGQPEFEWQGTGKTVVVSDDRKQAVTWFDDGRILWLRADQMTAPWEWSHDPAPKSAWFNSVGTRVLTWGPDKVARLWERGRAAPVREWKHNCEVRAMRFAPRTTRLLTWGQDSILRLWDSASDMPIRTWEHKHSFEPLWRNNLGVEFSADESHFVTWSTDGTFRTWNVEQVNSSRNWESPSDLAAVKGQGMIVGAKFTTDNRRLVTFMSGPATFLWDVTQKEPQRKWNKAALIGEVESDSGWHMLLSGDEGLELWDVRLDRLVQRWRQAGSCNALEIHPSGSPLLTWSKQGDGVFRMWDIAKQESLSYWKHDKTLFTTKISRNGDRVLTSGSDKTARLWIVGQERPIQVWEHPKGVASAKFNQEESLVLTRGANVTLWDVGQNRPVVVLRPKSEATWSWVQNASFMDDDTKVLAEDTNHVALWNVQVDDSLTLGQRKDELEALSGTTMNADGHYRKLPLDEWLVKRAAYRAKFPERWQRLIHP